MISGHLCNDHSREFLAHLTTGNLLATSEQSGKFRIHTSSRPAKLINGIFNNTGVDFYISGGRQLGLSGIVEVEVGGCMNAYLDFGSSVGVIEQHGTISGDSSLGKAVLINNPVHAHWFPATGYGASSGKCSICGRQLF
jgi:hypothetical protein